MPFIPAAACPETVQRYSYLPALATFTVSVALEPGLIIGVTLPLHVFAVPPVLAAQSSKSWGRLPLFVILKVTEPCATFLGESVNENSFAAVIETFTVAPFVVAPAIAGMAAKIASTAVIAPTV